MIGRSRDASAPPVGAESAWRGTSPNPRGSSARGRITGPTGRTRSVEMEEALSVSITTNERGCVMATTTYPFRLTQEVGELPDSKSSPHIRPDTLLLINHVSAVLVDNAGQWVKWAEADDTHKAGLLSNRICQHAKRLNQVAAGKWQFAVRGKSLWGRFDEDQNGAA